MSRVRMVNDPIAENQVNRIREKVEKILNYQTTRSRFASEEGIDPRRSINDECGYPETRNIRLEDYRNLYERNPIAKKVVDLLPLHCWQVQPRIVEDDNPEKEDTAFEVAIKELGDKLRGASWYQDEGGDPVWEYLSRVDKISGIGHYATLLIGVGGPEGERLDQPLDFKPGATANRELIYLRAFPEDLSTITAYEQDPSSPRYDLPTQYSMSFDETTIGSMGSDTAIRVSVGEQTVHWSRVVHITDEIISNEVFAMPRMLSVFNRLLDLDKIFGGSGEMYWKGAFPGLSLETVPQLGGDVVIDTDALRDMMENHENGLQRYLALVGMHANSLAPQVVDPTPQINANIEAICIERDCPKRIFMGSERGELASSQDQDHWGKVLQSRRVNYITPRIIVPTTNRLILLNVLPQPEGYSVKWPEVETLGELEKADVALKLTQAIIAYVSGDGAQLMPVGQYLTLVLGFSSEESDTIIEILDEEGMIDKMNEDALKDDTEEQLRLQESKFGMQNEPQTNVPSAK